MYKCICYLYIIYQKYINNRYKIENIRVLKREKGSIEKNYKSLKKSLIIDKNGMIL